MDLGSLFLLLAIACTIPAVAVLAACLVQHRTWGPRMRRHARTLGLVAAAAWGISSVSNLLGTDERSGLELVASLTGFLLMLVFAISARPEEGSPS